LNEFEVTLGLKNLKIKTGS